MGGKEPTYLELEGIEISEYPSAGISVGSTLILNKDVGPFLQSMDYNISGFDIFVEHYVIDCEWNRPFMMFIGADNFAKHDYGVILKDVGETIHTMQRLTKKQKLKVLFTGIGDGRLLKAFHDMGCICYGCECNAVLLKEAREMLNGEGSPWNFS